MKSLMIKIMEKELNIAAILEGKPSAKLWSPIIGVCALNHINSSSDINVTIEPGIYYNGSAIYSMTFNSRGKYGGEFKDNTIERECMLFPSKKMRDWEKFAWKKGDVLKVETGSDCSCIFDRFTNDDYTEFTGVFDKYLDRFDYFATSDWCKVTDEKEYESIIQRIETQYGGKLNLDTLRIEKPQFKDGDIIKHGKNIYIVQNFTDSYVHIYAGLIGKTGEVITRRLGISSNFGCSNLATDSEKQQLFAALEKEGKRWNPETKTLEDLPKKCGFKPLDYILVRDKSHVLPMWQLYQYAHENENYIYVVGSLYGLDRDRIEFIPYNDQTAYLLGTTDDWKGGE